MRRFIVICLALLAPLAACGEENRARASTRPAQQQSAIRAASDDEPDARQNFTAGRTGALPEGMARCVESYNPQAVTGRAFAFDGVVVDIGASVLDRGHEGDLNAPGVTFKVREWFSGGSADTVTIDVQVPNTEFADPSDLGYSFGIGSRLLVSGRWGGSPLDDPIAWGCGFSRYHDPETARAWHDAFAR